jgi:hypothetical protein
VAFNGYSRFAIWAAKHYHGTQSVADLIKSPGFDDPANQNAGTPQHRPVATRNHGPARPLLVDRC